MIVTSELSKRRIRSMSQIIRVGRQEVVVVLRVDKEKGYIDLSKRKVTPDDILRCEERFNKSKTVHTILQNVAETQHKDLEQLYRTIAWPLYKKYGHAYDAFKQAIADQDRVFAGIEIEPPVFEYLMQMIRRRLTPTPVRIRADIEVTCFSYEGIEAIKNALLAAESVSNEEVKIEAKVIAAPLYGLFSTVLAKERGIAAINAAVELARSSIEAARGSLVVKKTPYVVSEREEDKAKEQPEEEQEEDSDSDESGEEEEEPEAAAAGLEPSGEGSWSGDRSRSGEASTAAAPAPEAKEGKEEDDH
eukprot:GAFH01001180.1.p1 GENE.GAFH01001180.1~~GAFH01001180.1.p1  ORF type:complete len:356 (+),score=96.11 GAFH01001180.1:159-1070(+)